MSEQLFRWVKATKEIFPEQFGDHQFRNTVTKRPISIGQAYSDVMIKEGPELVEMLVEVTPSLNAGSLEEAAEEYAERRIKRDGKSVTTVSIDDIVEELKDAFLEGALHIKWPKNQLIPGTEPITATKPQKHLIRPERLAGLERLAEITGQPIDGIIAGWWLRIAEVQTLELELEHMDNMFTSRPSLDIDKVVKQLRDANPNVKPSGDTSMLNDAYWKGWVEAANKLQELLNKSK